MSTAITFGSTTAEWRLGDFVVTRTHHGRGLTLAPHDHDPGTMVVVLDGDCRETIGSRLFCCTRGAVVLKPPGAHHSDFYATASTALLVTLTSRHAPRDVGFVRSTEAMALASRLDRELGTAEPSARLIAEGLVLELLGLGMRAVERVSTRRPAWLATVVELLEESDAPSLAGLAAAVDRHPSHVAREFRKHYGCSPGDHHRALRLERARDALRTTGRSLAEIAATAGFYDQSHFTNAFRRRFGVTPARFRNAFPSVHRGSKTCRVRDP